MAASLAKLLDRSVAAITGALAWLLLPVVALLFLQWPLRDLVQAWSREANDLGQLLFALYVSAAVTAATRERTHLAADVLAGRYSATRREQLSRIGAALVLVPWSLFILASGSKAVFASIAGLEGFPETFNPGYFVVKFAVWLLAVLVLLQAVADTCGGSRPSAGPDST
jgi:TRAP-type mannitol/chloroaromatic compound transport system permease small subunit